MSLFPVRAFACDKLGSKELATPVATGADNLPAGIIVPPGVYNIFGRSVDMTKEQIYRVADFNSQSVQVISYTSDFDALITSIAWTGQIGYGDVTYSTAMMQAVRTRDISTTCGAISAVAQSLLAQAGITSRNVGGAAELPSDFNGYDDGHTILEVRHNGKWCAFDFLLKFQFMDADGIAPISQLELHDALRDNLPVTFRPLIPQVVPADVSKYIWLHDNIRSNTYAEYKRLFGMVYVPIGTAINVMYENAAQQDSIPPRGSIPVSRADYIAAYYGKTFTGMQPNTTSGWGALYTVADTSLQLEAGTIVDKLGWNLSSPAVLKPKILKQATTGSFAAMKLNPEGEEYSFSHPGGGWADFTIPGGYVIPATGIYRPGMSGNPGTIPFSTIGSRSIFAGDLPSGQSGAFSYATNGGICMRWTQA